MKLIRSVTLAGCAVSVAFLLAACSSPVDGGGAIPGGGVSAVNYSKIGTVTVSTIAGNRVLIGSFFKVSTPISLPANAVGRPDEACFVTKGPVAGPPPPISTTPGSDQTSTLLDAGAELKVVSGTQTVSLKRGALLANIYTTESGATVPDVAGATITIPGATDGFPAMTGVFPPELADFTFTSPASVTKDAVFTWTAATPGAYVIFGTSSVTGTDKTDVFCLAKDDGELSFSAATKAEMVTKGFTSGTAPTSAIKTIAVYKIQGDALLGIGSTKSSTPSQ